MILKRNRTRILVALITIVLIYSFELAFVSEATGVEEHLRKVLHVVSYISVVMVGYYYWKTAPPEWMKNLWKIAHILLLLILICVSILQIVTQVFSTLFLDQISYVRLFFTSPLPFLISLLIPKIPIFKD